jgi:hypothetical protein
MPPVRHRDARNSSSSTSSQPSVRPGARELTIEAPSANGRDTTITNDFDSAFAAKEVELFSLLSPSASVSLSSQAFLSREQLSSFPWGQFPEFIDSFDSFSAMKVVFLNFLVKNELSHLIPESKLYRSVYFPYGYLPQASPIDLLSEQIWCS